MDSFQEHEFRGESLVADAYAFDFFRSVYSAHLAANSSRETMLVVQFFESPT